VKGGCYGVLPREQMQGPTRERWLEICEQVIAEQDPDKFLKLITELNDLLDEKEERLLAQRKGMSEHSRSGLRVPVIPYIPISPIALSCPECGAEAGQPCNLLKGEVELVHVNRIRVAAGADVAAKRIHDKGRA
jgi:hypothetical protein